MARHRRPPFKTWRTFLANRVDQIVAADFFVVPTVTYRLLFVLVILAHRRRDVVHVAVTAHPTTSKAGPHRLGDDAAPIRPTTRLTTRLTLDTRSWRTHNPPS